MRLFYKPKHGTVGDVIPFYDNGEFKPFYLKGNRNYFGDDATSGWTMLSTKDHLHFSEHPTGIRGGTGSVIKTNDQYYLFYCTFSSNPKRQVVRRAISKDLDLWEEDKDFIIKPDGQIYELTDWRDPFVFKNEDTGEWWMLIAAKEICRTNRSGCVALMTSKDLDHWEYQKPLYSPHIHMSAHECPDLFKMGDWYYLVYSQYTDRFETYYRMSRSLNGPWKAPAVDTFDTRCFYAAKTGTDGTHRYIYGWNPTRLYDMWGFNPPFNPGHDYNSFDWGDTMIVHELVQNEDGTLSVKVPESVDQALTVHNMVMPEPANGSWTIDDQNISVSLEGAYGTCFLKNRVPELCKLEADIVMHQGVREAGIALQLDQNFDRGYYLSLQPARERLEYKTGLRMYDEGGWIFPYDVEMERPVHLALDVPHKVRIFIQDTILLCYVDDQIALNTRMYDFTHGYFGLFASGGDVEFRNVRLWT